MPNSVKTPADSDRRRTVLVAGATGFVGQALLPFLEEAGHDIVATSRSERTSTQECVRWVRMDVSDAQSVRGALAGCDAAVYLVHSMGDASGDYEERELSTARNFLRLAEECGVARIVYLGGIEPEGKPSKHLRSRLATGAALRAGKVSTLELQATMIIGVNSESWRMVRDLAARLPAMVLPRWLQHRSEPVWIGDVCAAITCAVELEHAGSGAYPLPGPEILSGVEILQRTAALMGLRAVSVNVPFVTPRLSSYWVQLVTRANRRVAAQLVEGLTSDLIADGKVFWDFMPEHGLRSFDDAAQGALIEERGSLPPLTRLAERLIRAVSLSPRRGPPGASQPKL